MSEQIPAAAAAVEAGCGAAPELRRARAAVAALFFTNGAVFAMLVPRYPDIKAALELSNTQFGLAVAMFPLGALLAGLLAAPLVRRWGSGPVAVVGTLLAATAVVAAGTAPVAAVLFLGLFAGGAADAVTDVAQNAHGLRVQRAYGRSILNAFHAAWSVGAVAGGLGGALAAGADVPPGVQLSVSGAVCCLVAVLAARALLPGPDAPEDPEQAAAGGATRSAGRGRLLRWGTIAALVLIATAAAVVEDVGASWSAIYLRESLGATALVAGSGFIALQASQVVGRLLGDRLVDRFGQRAVARAGGALVAVGMGQALLLPSAAGTVIGLGLAGLGIATLIPAAMQTADELPGLRAGTGLTVVGWLLRAGILVSPPAIGVVADATSLRAALVVVPVVGVLVVLLAGVLPARSAARRGSGPSGGTPPAEAPEVLEVGDDGTLTLRGEVDLTSLSAAAGARGLAVAELPAALGPVQRVDLSAVTFADTAALGLLAGLAAQSPDDHAVTVVGAGAGVRRMLSLSGLDRRVRVVEVAPG